ncbi:MAG: S8 family serine peptidase, partial [Rhizobacter sp.]|nr:S8 family serine peptidase [Rhizobacter sp.]
QDAIDELRALGVVVVAAAGNGHGEVKRPASCAGVIGVAALNRDGFKASYSNFGPSIVVSTVGGDPSSEGRWGSLLGDDGMLSVDNLGVQGPEAAIYGRHAGTSFSTPVVAGVVSLMLSINPALSVDQIIDGVRRSARPHVRSQLIGACSALNPGRCICSTATCGAGILDAPQALAFAADPSAYVAPAQAAALIDSGEVAAAVALGPDQPPNAQVNPASGGGGGSLGLSSLWWGVLALAGLVMVGRRTSGA